MGFITEYEYLIAYTSTSKKNKTGIGRTCVILKQPISSGNDLVTLEGYIGEGNNDEQILITHYQLIRKMKTINIRRIKQKNDDTTND